MSGHVLIASLGSEPQVVTLVLDLLTSQGHPINKVIVVHTSGKVALEALKSLSSEPIVTAVIVRCAEKKFRGSQIQIQRFLCLSIAPGR